jgi:6-pyruvoyl-tetrahydropterin synthase
MKFADNIKGKAKEKAKGVATGLDPAIVAKINDITKNVMNKMAEGKGLIESVSEATEEAILDEIKSYIWQEIQPMLPDDRVVQNLAKRTLDNTIDSLWDKFKDSIMETAQELEEEGILAGEPVRAGHPTYGEAEESTYKTTSTSTQRTKTVGTIYGEEEKKWTPNRYVGIFTILLGLISVFGFFIPIATGLLDSMGLAGWDIKLSLLLNVNKESVGVFTVFLNVFSSIFAPIPEPNLIITVLGYIIALLCTLVIIFGTVEIIKKKSIAYSIVNIIISVVAIAALFIDYYLFRSIVFPGYVESFLTASFFIASFPGSPVFISYLILAIMKTISRDIGFFLISISQGIILIISIVALVLTSVQKKRGHL